MKIHAAAGGPEHTSNQPGPINWIDSWQLIGNPPEAYVPLRAAPDLPDDHDPWCTDTAEWCCPEHRAQEEA